MQFYIKKQYLIALCIYLGQILFGFNVAWPAPVFPKLQDPAQTPLDRVLSETELSWVMSILFLGSVLGPHLASFLSNRKGRKPCLIIACIIVTLAFILGVVAKDLPLLLLSRFLAGVGVGVFFVLDLVYIGEIASTNIRGVLLSATGIFTALGTLAVYSIGPFVSYHMLSYIGIGMTLVYLSGILLIPESPVFQVLHGNEAEARKIMKFLGRTDEIEKVFDMSEKHESETIGVEMNKILTVKTNRKALFVTLPLNVLQQLSGIGTILAFSTTIFHMAGSSIPPYLATIIIGLMKVLATIVAPLFVERCGRRFLLLVSTTVTTLSLIVLTIYQYLYEAANPAADNIKWLPLVATIAFFVAYDMGFGIIPETLIGEMFELKVRSIGSSISITVSWLVGFFVSTAYGYIVTYIGLQNVFLIYSVFSLIAVLFSAFFVPETKGKTLLEIQELLNK